MPVDANHKKLWISALNNSLKDTYPFWVLFENGTYVIIEEDQPDSIEDIVSQAIRVLSYCQTRQQTIYTIDRDTHFMEQGALWVVPNEVGIYTLVSPEEFQDESPSEIALTVKGRNKCIQDCEEKNVLYVSCPDQLCTCIPSSPS